MSGGKIYSAVRNVEFHETDMAGIVHFSNVFRFVEYAETMFFRNGGMNVFDPSTNRRWPILSAECNYLKPITFGDALCIDLTVKRIGNKSLTLGFAIKKESSGKSGEVAAEGLLAVVHALQPGRGNSIVTERIPDSFRDYLRDYLDETEEGFRP